MNEKKVFNVKLIIVLAILIVAISTTLGVLVLTNVIKKDVSAFLVMFTSMIFLSGLAIFVVSVIRKDGYEYAVGSILLFIGFILLFILFKVKVLVSILLLIGILLVLFLGLFLLKSKDLVKQMQTTDEKENFVPYMEQLKAQKEQEKAEEQELPEIKSFKD